LMELPKSVMLAAVLNSNCAQSRTVPTAPDAVRLTVVVGVVSTAPAGICAEPVETNRYGNVGFGPAKPEKTPPVVDGGALFDASHPVTAALVQSMIVSGALPEGGRLGLVPPAQVMGPEADALTKVDPDGIS